MGSQNNDVVDYPKIKLEDYLKQLCSYALSIGMTMEEYWDKEPYLINYYVEAERIRQKKLNTQLWLNGFYVYNAIGCLVPVLNPFSKDHKAKPYLKQPIPLTEEEREEELNAKAEKFKNQLLARINKGGK